LKQVTRLRCLPRIEHEGIENKSYYKSNKEDILSDRKDKYVKEIRSERHNEDYYRDVVTSRIKSVESCKELYHKDVDKARIKSAEGSKAQYHKDVDKSRADTSKRVKEHYHKNLDKSHADTSETVKEHYHKDLDKSHADTSERVKEHYHKDLDKSCADASERVKEHYHKDLDKSRADTSERVKEHYHKDLENLVLILVEESKSTMWLSLELTVNLMMDGVIVRAGSGLLLERTASSPAGRVGYSPDREAHATIPLNSCTHVITIT